jgi:hypothetical protein
MTSRNKDAMLSCLLLSATLTMGQAGGAPAEPPAAEAPVPSGPTPEAPKAAAVPPADRWLLMKALQGTWAGALLDSERMQLTGWADMSYTASSDRRTNLPMGFNYQANEFLLQQNWIRFERTVVTSGTTEPTFGFRSDWILPGSDYRFTLARGIFDSQLTASNGRPITYGVDPIQFYAEAYFPTIGQGLDVKFGRFFCIYGVESNAAVDNAIWSHAYTFIYDPFTHSGVMGTLKLTPAWTAEAGLVTGSDIFIAPPAVPTTCGRVIWAPPGGPDSVLFAWIVGPGRFNQEQQFHNPEVFDLIYNHRFNPRLIYNLEALYGFTYNVPKTGFANWMGLIDYLTYTVTPQLNTNARLEFFDDFQGQRTGFAGLYTVLTLGLNFRPYKSVIIRPEIRYDRNWQSRPFDDRHDLFTAGSDIILRW